jgi:hypothetical protein
MPNLIYACWRGPTSAFSREVLEHVADRITPETLPPLPHHCLEGPDECICLTGSNRTPVFEGLSAYAGAFTGAWKDWHKPGSPIPEGSFALIRSNHASTELCSDFAGTRTIWYTFAEHHLLASTCQRALICLLRSLSLNRSAFAWFLSSGTLGPADSWDSRICRLPAGARLTLDRSRWTIQVHTSPVVFEPSSMSKASATGDLHDILRMAVKGFDFKSDDWILPLSGGYDSRFLLAELHNGGFRPRTVTWGLASSRTQRGNDACIARRLAAHYGLRNDYFITEMSGAPPREVVDSFLAASGGTTDSLFPYLDGLKLWSGFTKDGVSGIIRGDEGFGTKPRPEAHHRFAQGLWILKDFLDDGVADLISDGRQVLPDDVSRHPGESVQTYGDRLVHSFFIPVNLAALSDVKSPFLEIANPLLARSVLEFVRRVPDPLRARRALYARLTESMSPPIPFATLAADDSGNHYLSSTRYRQWIVEELQGDFACCMLPQKFRESLLLSQQNDSLSTVDARSTRAMLKRIIPESLVVAARSWINPPPPATSLMAFRVALASRLARILEGDAGSLLESGEPVQLLAGERRN